MYCKLERMLPLEEMLTVLDVGVTADRKCGFTNFFEAMFPHPDRITAFSDQDASWMCGEWPGLKFVRGDARKMPFPDNSFDFVFSSAVIEHVGSRDCQLAFLRECFRVARKWVFVTTPNRWFPVEMHTTLPLLHWLPMRWHRKIIRSLGFEALSREENLNLLDEKSLRRLLAQIDGEHFEIRKMHFFGFASNLLLVAKKGGDR